MRRLTLGRLAAFERRDAQEYHKACTTFPDGELYVWASPTVKPARYLSVDSAQPGLPSYDGLGRFAETLPGYEAQNWAWLLLKKGEGAPTQTFREFMSKMTRAS